MHGETCVQVSGPGWHHREVPLESGMCLRTSCVCSSGYTVTPGIVDFRRSNGRHKNVSTRIGQYTDMYSYMYLWLHVYNIVYISSPSGCAVSRANTEEVPESRSGKARQHAMTWRRSVASTYKKGSPDLRHMPPCILYSVGVYATCGNIYMYRGRNIKDFVCSTPGSLCTCNVNTDAIGCAAELHRRIC